MKTNPLFQFDSTTDTGIHLVPDNALILIKDSDGSGNPLQVQKLANTGLTESSTIADFLADNTLHKPVGGGNTSNFIQKDTTGTTSIANFIWTGTQAEYDALGIYQDDVLYFIK